jgi:hypothetical protein
MAHPAYRSESMCGTGNDKPSQVPRLPLAGDVWVSWQSEDRALADRFGDWLKNLWRVRRVGAWRFRIIQCAVRTIMTSRMAAACGQRTLQTRRQRAPAVRIAAGGFRPMALTFWQKALPGGRSSC